METALTAVATINIHAPVESVWDALTKPELIKQYFFGTDTKTDWKVGSQIVFSGEWDGKSYEDKGTILEIERNALITYSYWSSMSGKPDIEENYAQITYQLSEENGVTTLNITQAGLMTHDAKEHSEKNWMMVLEGLKKLLEGKNA